jgi:ElaB/YqjD/DUF883 family membrane-anchored ribosome-binding protein
MMAIRPKQTGDEIRKKVTTVYGSGKEKAEAVTKNVRDSSAKAVDTAKSRVRTTASKTGQSLDNNPITALIGGLAIGAIAAALLPKTKRESEAFGKASNKVRSTASAAAKAARDAGKEQLDALGLNSSAARDQLRGVIEKIGQAASTASKAATDAVRKKP